LRALPLALLLLGPGAAPAGVVERVETRHEGGVYTVDLDMVIHAQAERVQSIVNDYDALGRLSSAIVESARLPPNGIDANRRRVVYRSCFVVYCITATIIEIVRFPAPLHMETEIEPAGSDFRAGHSEWEIVPVDGARSRIRMHVELEPAFWVPPVVGPWIISRKMRAAAQETGMRLEQLAAAHD
jgi:hypothetical protein